MANTTGLPVLFATGIHSARPAASAVGSGGLYSCTTHSLVYQTDGSSWTTWAAVGGSSTRASLGLDTTDSPEFAGLNVGAPTDTTITRTGAGEIAVEGNRIFRVGGADVPVADGGTGASTASGARTNLGLVLGTDVASLTAGVVPIAQLATGTPDGTKFIRDDGTLQTPAGGGGGGLAQSYAGYNTVGGTWTATTGSRLWAKPVTFAATTTVLGISVHIRPNQDSTGGGWRAALLSDIAGAPGLILGSGMITGLVLQSNATSGFPGTGHWESIAIGETVASGNYWIAFEFTGGVVDIANDTTGGGDVRWDQGFDGISGGHTALARTTTTIRHSVRANILS